MEIFHPTFFPFRDFPSESWKKGHPFLGEKLSFENWDRDPNKQRGQLGVIFGFTQFQGTNFNQPTYGVFFVGFLQL